MMTPQLCGRCRLHDDSGCPYGCGCHGAHSTEMPGDEPTAVPEDRRPDLRAAADAEAERSAREFLQLPAGRSRVPPNEMERYEAIDNALSNVLLRIQLAKADPTNERIEAMLSAPEEFADIVGPTQEQEEWARAT